MHVGLGEALVRVAEEDFVEAVERLDGIVDRAGSATGVRWHAAIGGAAIVEIFVSKVDARVRPGLDADGRVDRVALKVDMAAEAVAILVHSVDAQAEARPKRLVDVAGESDAA